MRKIDGLNPDRLKYEILETKGEQLAFGWVDRIKDLVYNYGDK
jgi:hypothetical protein